MEFFGDQLHINGSFETTIFFSVVILQVFRLTKYEKNSLCYFHIS